MPNQLQCIWKCRHVCVGWLAARGGFPQTRLRQVVLHLRSSAAGRRKVCRAAFALTPVVDLFCIFFVCFCACICATCVWLHVGGDGCCLLATLVDVAHTNKQSRCMSALHCARAACFLLAAVCWCHCCCYGCFCGNIKQQPFVNNVYNMLSLPLPLPPMLARYTLLLLPFLLLLLLQTPAYVPWRSCRRPLHAYIAVCNFHLQHKTFTRFALVLLL